MESKKVALSDSELEKVVGGYALPGTPCEKGLTSPSFSVCSSSGCSCYKTDYKDISCCTIPHFCEFYNVRIK